MRTILADTQIAVWLMLGNRHLPRHITDSFLDEENLWIFHQTSLWEIQIKHNLGKFPLPTPPAQYFPKALAETNFEYRTIQNEAIYFLAKLPSIHRDPFDRLLVAHALVNGWELATTDKVLQTYPVKIFG